MATHAARLARIFTAEYACRVNAQLVHPAAAQLVKPNELASALARPLHAAAYAPDSRAAYLAATLAYGIIQGHPFLDGNKRTAFFLANEYLRAQGLPSLLDGITDNDGLVEVAERHIAVAAGRFGVDGLLRPSDA
ncbi:hypothetical protein PsYK624_140540 [Phanerochaete sordida]|uniref:Fido domain-containing protein n=1 Tax=Phanerochaete sordida TaxID=48140 RepID=A0A9P3GM09_9APHY|nr:hypothetical protein PsYK624_140540 [Phanerochaete sordida]